MSWVERRGNPLNAFVRPAVILAIAAALGGVSGCTVRPLYSSAPASPRATTSIATELSSIAIKPVKTRQAQEVRNHLIFLLQGGAAASSSPAYTLDLRVVSRNEVAATVQVTTVDEEPTASTVTMIGSYTLTDTETGDVVAKGSRQIASSYDVPRQEFAALRARRDAENRSARELAELLRLAIAQDIARK
jgi:LPS-assembly lipoprotein